MPGLHCFAFYRTWDSLHREPHVAIFLLPAPAAGPPAILARLCSLANPLIHVIIITSPPPAQVSHPSENGSSHCKDCRNQQPGLNIIVMITEIKATLHLSLSSLSGSKLI